MSEAEQRKRLALVQHLHGAEPAALQWTTGGGEDTQSRLPHSYAAIPVLREVSEPEPRTNVCVMKRMRLVWGLWFSGTIKN